MQSHSMPESLEDGARAPVLKNITGKGTKHCSLYRFQLDPEGLYEEVEPLIQVLSPNVDRRSKIPAFRRN